MVRNFFFVIYRMLNIKKTRICKISKIIIGNLIPRRERNTEKFKVNEIFQIQIVQSNRRSTFYCKQFYLTVQNRSYKNKNTIFLRKIFFHKNKFSISEEDEEEVNNTKYRLNGARKRKLVVKIHYWPSSFRVPGIRL